MKDKEFLVTYNDDTYLVTNRKHTSSIEFLDRIDTSRDDIPFLKINFNSIIDKEGAIKIIDNHHRTFLRGIEVGKRRMQNKILDDLGINEKIATLKRQIERLDKHEDY